MNNQDEYKVENWADIEHCVYHALVDEPDAHAMHRVAKIASLLAATLVEKELLTTEELEAMLRSCRM